MSSLSFSLQKNRLKGRKGEYYAKSYRAGTYTEEDIVDKIVEFNSTIQRPDALGVMSVLRSVIIKALSDGYNVNLALFRITSSVTGLFENSLDTFKEKRNYVRYRLTKGTALRAAEANAPTPQKVDSPLPNPQIKEVLNGITKVNTNVLRGKAIELRGVNLRIEGEDKACGLWFVDANNQSVKAEEIIDNQTKRVTALVPADLAPGEYTIKIVSQYSSGKATLKTPRAFEYQEKVTVS